jgi:hypothetical protein
VAVMSFPPLNSAEPYCWQNGWQEVTNLGSVRIAWQFWHLHSIFKLSWNPQDSQKSALEMKRVSHFPLQRQFDWSRWGYMGFVADKVALRRAFPRYSVSSTNLYSTIFSTIHESSYHPALYHLDTDCVVRKPANETGTHTRVILEYSVFEIFCERPSCLRYFPM